MGLRVEVQAPINIALIKYWGKRNEDLILPLNDSISLSINELKATTTIDYGPEIAKDSVCLNGQWVDISSGLRFRRVFDEVRRLHQIKQKETNEKLKTTKKFKPWHLRIVSKTNFPIAAGLASSAAGFAAIASGLGRIFDLPESEVIRLARIGSGSACRSVQDGFVHWKAGTSDLDDLDCCCETIMPSTHWDSLRAVIIVLNEARKKVGSSVGMRQTVRTSTLLNARLKMVPKRVSELRDAIIAKNFAKLAEITMAESNQLHAVCLDTYPPLKYMNSDSHLLIEFVHDFNAHEEETKLAYTFDAGPNCCLLMEAETMPLFLSKFAQCFNLNKDLLKKLETFQLNDETTINLTINNSEFFPWPIASNIHIENIVYSKIGLGSRLLNSENDNINDEASHPSAAIGQIDCQVL